jgi:hypothetical protein
MLNFTLKGSDKLNKSKISEKINITIIYKNTKDKQFKILTNELKTLLNTAFKKTVKFIVLNDITIKKYNSSNYYIKNIDNTTYSKITKKEIIKKFGG